jgi:hypothetical protein
MKDAAKSERRRIVQMSNKAVWLMGSTSKIQTCGGFMETKKHWKIVSAGIWVAGMTVAMLASLVHSLGRNRA